MPDAPRQLAVIIACFNRSALTERAVKQILNVANEARVDVRVFVFNDASTDDTAIRLQAIDGPVNVKTGPGDYYWAASMAAAEHEALRWISNRGHILWLNDDVDLSPSGALAAIKSALHSPEEVLVGETNDPESPGKVTYGGFRWAGPHPLRYLRTRGSGERVDAFNGNFVLVPAAIARKLGGIDGGFTHALADIDYGVRLRKEGVALRVLEQAVGTCAWNAPASGTLVKRWKAFIGPKGGGNPRSLTRFLKKSKQYTWLLWITVTYVQWWRRALWRHVRRRGSA